MVVECPVILSWKVKSMFQAFAHADVVDVIKPGIFTLALVLFLLYLFFACGPTFKSLPERPKITRKQIWSFGLGCAVLYLSFGGPLDYLSDNYLFSVHMAQHMAEILIMTPLLVYGTPAWMMAPVLRIPGVRVVFKWCVHPVVASVLFNAVVNLFHLPALYDLALNYDSFHFVEHLCFFAVSILLWLARRPLTPGQQLIFLLFNYNLMMPLVVLMLIAQHPWYTFYVTQPRLAPWMTPLVDQEFGALIMAGAMMGSYVLLGVRAYWRQDESVWYE